MRPLPHPNQHQLFAKLEPIKRLCIVRSLVKAHTLSRDYSIWHRKAYPNCNLVLCTTRHLSARQWHRWRNAHMQILDYIETTD